MEKTTLLCAERETECRDGFSRLFDSWKTDFSVCDSFDAISDETRLLIISEQFIFPQKYQIKHPVIISSDNTAGLHQLSTCEMPVYTCGFHEKDCLSYSSLLHESRTISLNRTIFSFSGVPIEPFEIPLYTDNLRNIDAFALLAFVLTMLLNDILPDNASKSFGKNYIT